jgi:hypothetical protein
LGVHNAKDSENSGTYGGQSHDGSFRLLIVCEGMIPCIIPATSRVSLAMKYVLSIPMPVVCARQVHRRGNQKAILVFDRRKPNEQNKQSAVPH